MLQMKNLFGRIQAFLRPAQPAPKPQLVVNLSRRHQRHEFILLQVVEPFVYKVQKDGKIQLIDMSGWRHFKHELLSFCQTHDIWPSALEAGKVCVHCVGVQENLPRGIKYTWRFTIL
jgi:hypothetical protein